jgi:hypothetical protein
MGIRGDEMNELAAMTRPAGTLTNRRKNKKSPETNLVSGLFLALPVSGNYAVPPAPKRGQVK